MRRVAAGLLIGLLAGCTGEPAPAPHIELVQLDNGNWRATWMLMHPVHVLRFQRPAHFYREQRWRVVTPGYSLQRDGDSQVLIVDDGAEPAARVTVEFPIDTRKFPREYEAFHRFTDGSVALYTGHLYATPDDAEPVRKLIITAANEGNVILPADPSGTGTYAYVGALEPVEGAHYFTLLDPDLPPWVAYTASRYVPEFFAILSERTGHPLPRKPLLMLNFEPRDQPGFESRGGTLHDLLQATVSGNDWHKPNPWAERNVLTVIAHEVTHFWNAQRVRFEPGAPPWMHEGSANALAQLLLLETGVIDEVALADGREQALNKCLAGAGDAYYPCGQLLAWWTELALADAGSRLDLFGFWGQMTDHYGEADYFALLAAEGVATAAVDRAAALIRPPFSSEGVAWQTAFAPLGVQLVRDDAAAGADAGMHAAATLLFSLLAADCGDEYGFYGHENHFELSGLEHCATAHDGMRIERLAGVSVAAPSLSAAHAVYDRCATVGSVEVGPVTLACPEALPPLRGYWRIE